jgi:ABC-type Fe3+-siderophore transport system permease subunit
VRNPTGRAVIVGIVAGFATLVALGWLFGAIRQADVPILAACFATISAGCFPLLASKSKPCPRTMTNPDR